MSSSAFASARLALVLGLPVVAWALMLGAGVFSYPSALLYLFMLPHVNLSVFLLIWVAIATSILLDWARGDWPALPRRSPWLNMAIALFTPLWLLGFLIMANLPGTVGLAFWLLVPALFATPLALLVLMGAALTGRLWSGQWRVATQ